VTTLVEGLRTLLPWVQEKCQPGDRWAGLCAAEMLRLAERDAAIEEPLPDRPVPCMPDDHFADHLRAQLQVVEARAGELADALDADDSRAVRIPDSPADRHRCLEVVDAARRVLRAVAHLLDPERTERCAGPAGAPWTLAEVRGLLWSGMAADAESLVLAPCADPGSCLPATGSIACYAVPTSDGAHDVHVAELAADAETACSTRRLLIARTTLGLDHALDVAARCSRIINALGRPN
jgi:hypothetical protein